jgi:hypothetical protein
MRPVGGVEQRLGARRRRVGALAVGQHQAADPRAHVGRTGLAGHHHVVAGLDQRLGQPGDLGGLARALATLEDHEDAVPGEVLAR